MVKKWFVFFIFKKKKKYGRGILLCCKESGLSIEELKHLTVGGALDFQTDYVELHTQHKSEQSTSKRANQSDMDNF